MLSFPERTLFPNLPGATEVVGHLSAHACFFGGDVVDRSAAAAVSQYQQALDGYNKSVREAERLLHPKKQLDALQEQDKDRAALQKRHRSWLGAANN